MNLFSVRKFYFYFLFFLFRKKLQKFWSMPGFDRWKWKTKKKLKKKNFQSFEFSIYEKERRRRRRYSVNVKIEYLSVTSIFLFFFQKILKYFPVADRWTTFLGENFWNVKITQKRDNSKAETIFCFFTWIILK